MRNTGSREKWRGNRSRGLRKAPGTRLRGRTPRRAARPPPRLHSDLVSPEPRAPGLLTSRPLLLQRAAQPQLPSLPLARPGSDFCSCASSPRPAPHALGTRPQSGGAGRGRAGRGRACLRMHPPRQGTLPGEVLHGTEGLHRVKGAAVSGHRREDTHTWGRKAHGRSLRWSRLSYSCSERPGLQSQLCHCSAVT